MRPADCDLDIRSVWHPCLFCLHAFWSLSASWPTYVPSVCRNYSCANLGLRVPSILNKCCVDLAILTFWALSQNFEQHLLASSCLSFCPSVRPSARNNSAPTIGIFMKLHVWLWKSIGKIQVSLKSGKNNGHCTLRHIHIFIISLSVPLVMRNVSEIFVRENENTCLTFNNIFSKNLAFY